MNLRSFGSHFEPELVGGVGFLDLVHLDPSVTSGLQAHIHCQIDSCHWQTLGRLEGPWGRYPSVDDRLEHEKEES